MLIFPDFEPVALSVGPIDIYWYGVCYLLGFLIALWFLWLRIRKQDVWNINLLADLMFYVALGVIFGGRFGFVLFYQLELLLSAPWELVKFWLPGRSFHGGLLGVLLALFIFCRKYRLRFLTVTDFIAPAVPIGIALGRLGNFINGELWGKVTNVPWGMVFPAIDAMPRHPSQLYELFLEGILLFVILYFYSLKDRDEGKISSLFLIFYGLFRMIVECFREPDHNIGYVLFDWVTAGQLLSLPMFLLGLGLFVFSRMRQKYKE